MQESGCGSEPTSAVSAPVDKIKDTTCTKESNVVAPAVKTDSRKSSVAHAEHHTGDENLGSSGALGHCESPENDQEAKLLKVPDEVYHMDVPFRGNYETFECAQNTPPLSLAVENGESCSAPVEEEAYSIKTHDDTKEMKSELVLVHQQPPAPDQELPNISAEPEGTVVMASEKGAVVAQEMAVFDLKKKVVMATGKGSKDKGHNSMKKKCSDLEEKSLHKFKKDSKMIPGEKNHEGKYNKQNQSKPLEKGAMPLNFHEDGSLGLPPDVSTDSTWMYRPTEIPDQDLTGPQPLPFDSESPFVEIPVTDSHYSIPESVYWAQAINESNSLLVTGYCMPP
jgi:hypothetical protein